MTCVWTDKSRSVERARLRMIRQQMVKSGGRPNLCLADFVAPSGADWIGGFAVTAGVGERALAAGFRERGDDYSAILVGAG